ncbi:MAG: lipoyl(octanoyl) transferase LipB [Chloroflexi bacterium]|nr:lipoyl(octanoyl) transferase LipB [Chloroflexota bacterium]
MKGWHLQKQLAEMIAQGEHPPTLILLQHSHVYTFGRRGSKENLLWDEGDLKRRGVDVHWIDRGGDVTYHGPGQLVGYPLLPLAGKGLQPVLENGKVRVPDVDYIDYLRKLENVIIKTLADFGVVSGKIVGQTGVWIQSDVLSKCVNCPPEQYKAPAKIASIGVKVDAKGISKHGFALNVNTDMSYFEGILACGLDNQNKANLAYLVEAVPSIDKVAAAIVKNFGAVFEYEMQQEANVVLL